MRATASLLPSRVGSANALSVGQTGSGNRILNDPADPFTQRGNQNSGSITVIGDNNQSWLTQQGNANQGTIATTGNGNQAFAGAHAGNENESFVTQVGNSNYAIAGQNIS